MFKEINTLKLFFENPKEEYNVREVARLLKITPATASKKLKELKRKGILKYRKERILDLYSSNMESSAYKDLKTYYNIRKLRASGLIDALNEFYLRPTILFFGSASQGLDVKESDFDLLVISEKKSKFPETEKYENKLKRELQLFIYKDVKDIRNKHLINNMVNGIILQGEITWI